MSAPNPTRKAQLLALLAERPHTAAECAVLLGVTTSTASQYLRELRVQRLAHPARLGGMGVPWKLGHVDLAELRIPRPVIPLVKKPVPACSVWDYASKSA